MAAAGFSAGAAVVSAIAQCVSTGLSVAKALQWESKSTASDKYCIIRIDNLTKFALTDPKVTADGGKIPCPPCNVLPGTREAMVAVNGYRDGGTFGTVSWRLGDLGCRVVVMWAVPWEKEIANSLGLGITTAKYHNTRWYDQMYYDKGTEELKYVKKMYNEHIHEIKVKNAALRVTGTMGSTKTCEALIQIIPRQQEIFTQQIIPRQQEIFAQQIIPRQQEIFADHSRYQGYSQITPRQTENHYYYPSPYESYGQAEVGRTCNCCCHIL